MPPPPLARAKRPAVTTPPPVVAVKERPPQRKPPPLPPSNAATLAALRKGEKKPAADPTQKEMQDKVGNGAVAAGLTRSPATDPKFGALKKDVKQKKRKVATSHPPPSKEATSAQDAAVPPKDDEVAQGKTANAEKMNEAKPKEFDKEAFIKAVEKAIAEKAPKNLEQADEFADSGKPAEVKAEVQGKVGEGRTESAEQIATTTAAPPDTSGAEIKQVVPMAPDRPPGTPGTPDPTKATPDKLPPSATDMSAGPAAVNQEMADAQVTEPQLKKSNEPTFNQALTDKKGAEQHSETAPDQLRKQESAQLKATTAAAKRLGAGAMGAIAAQRVNTGQQVGGGKTNAKTRDEEKRAQVTAILQKVFDTMKTEVEDILTGLDKLVDDQFTRGEKEARDAFTAEHKKKMEEYKDRRYGGDWGWIKWGRDKLLGLPEEANQIFVEARENYVRRMRGVISDVADTIGRELKRAKDRIAKGREDLHNEVKKLPKDLQAIGKEAAGEFADKFDELTQSVDDKSTELVDTLATKYTDAVKAVDDEIAAEKEKNKGLVDKALDAVKGVIETILELKRLLLGVLAKAAQAVMGILKDPIGFLGGLITGVGGGLKLFGKNAKRHLEGGVIAWLLGTGVTGGLQLPTSFDVLGILLMLAALLGLSAAALRTRLARKVPPKAMTAAETGADAIPMVVEVRKRGVAGMWSDLKGRVGDLKKELISGLVSYLLPTILIAGITWIVSLFNPASAFIRACKMIIDIIRFIVTQGRQIIEFINAVLDAVIAISKGGAGGVPPLIERALAKSIPVLIGALAAILGIGGIAGKVKGIFQKLARPVNRAIDWVIDKLAGLIKKLWAKIKPKPKKTRDRDPKKDPRKKDDRKKDGDKRKLVKEALKASQAALRSFDGGFVPEDTADRPLTRVRSRFRKVKITISPSRGKWRITAEINPKSSGDSDAGVLDSNTRRELSKAQQLTIRPLSQARTQLRPKGPVERKAPAKVERLRAQFTPLDNENTTRNEQLDRLRKGASVEFSPTDLIAAFQSLTEKAIDLVRAIDDALTSPNEKVTRIKEAHKNLVSLAARAKRVTKDPKIRQTVLDDPVYAGLNTTINEKMAALEEFLSNEGRLPANLANESDERLTTLLDKLREQTSLANALHTDVNRADRESNPAQAIVPRIEKIDQIDRNTTKAGRPGADVGDGTSEAALKHEAKTGEPYKSPQGHHGKIADAIRGLDDAIADLQRISSQAAEPATQNKIATALAKANKRKAGLQSGMAAWAARVSQYPDKWNPDGTSKVKPGWP